MKIYENYHVKNYMLQLGLLCGILITKGGSITAHKVKYMIYYDGWKYYNAEEAKVILAEKLARKNPAQYTPQLMAQSYKVADVIVNAMEKHGLHIGISKNENMGEMVEAVITCILTGEKMGRVSKANKVDYRNKRGGVEIKLATNSKDKATPLTEAYGTWLITSRGVSHIAQWLIQDMLDNPQDYKRYVQVKGGGIALKPTAYELGNPHKKLDKLLGF